MADKANRCLSEAAAPAVHQNSFASPVTAAAPSAPSAPASLSQDQERKKLLFRLDARSKVHKLDSTRTLKNLESEPPHKRSVSSFLICLSSTEIILFSRNATFSDKKHQAFLNFDPLLHESRLLPSKFGG